MAFTGQTLTVEVELENPGRWPLTFINLEDLPPESLRGGRVTLKEVQKGFVVSLGHKQTYRYSYSFVPEHDGQRHIGVAGGNVGIEPSPGFGDDINLFRPLF